ncbi:MAG: tetratricopeptide repeat protein [Bacteroidia bacterium]
MKRSLKYLLFLLLFSGKIAFSQHHTVDSLLQVIKTKGSDTATAFSVVKAANEMQHDVSAIDSCKKIHDAVIKTMAGSRDSMALAAIYYTIGTHYYDYHNNGALAHIAFLNSKNYLTDIYTQTGRKALSALVMDYKRMGDFPKSIEYSMQLAKINEATGSKNGLSVTWRHLSELMTEQGNNELSLEYALKSYNLALTIPGGYQHSNAFCYTIFSLARSYMNLKDFENAHNKALEGIKIAQEINDKWAETDAWDTQGQIFMVEGNYPAALSCYNKGVEAKRSVNDTMPGLAYVYGNMANTYSYMKEPASAIYYAKRSIEMSKMLEDYGQIRSMAGILAETYGTQKDFAKGYSYAMMYVKMSDSIYSADKIASMEAIRLENDFAREKEKEKVITKQKAQKQKLILWTIALGLAVALVFSFIIFRSLRITRRQKQIIEEKNTETERQKSIIELKNKDITDSINYARKIQDTLLPSEKYIAEQLRRLKKE